MSRLYGQLQMLDTLRHVRHHLSVSTLGQSLNVHHGLAAPVGEVIALCTPFVVFGIRQSPHLVDGRRDVPVRDHNVDARDVSDGAEAALDLDGTVVDPLEKHETRQLLCSSRGKVKVEVISPWNTYPADFA